MRILILGGTGFIGTQMSRDFMEAGHQVSVLSRGQTPAVLPEGVERLTGNRELSDGLEALGERTWEACVDLSGYLPQQVQASGKRLSTVKRYVFVSAVAVYGDPPGPVTEDQFTPRLTATEQAEVRSVDDLDDRTYGPSKVACEDELRRLYGERLTVLRPQVVTGPGDPTQRYTPWLARAAGTDSVLVPGDGTDLLQVIDVRDLARFTLQILETDQGGVFNLAGPRLTWRDFMQILGVQHPLWVSLDLLIKHQVSLAHFPLYRPAGGVRSGLMNVDHSRARAAGLQLTPPEITAQDIRETFGTAELLALNPPTELENLRRLLIGSS